MNFELIGNLVRLRYKLLWAKTRSRNGRIALFMVCYLLLVLLIALLASGGFGAALVAVRTGKAEFVAQAVLSSLYVQAVVAAVVLGFGVNAIFSEAQLRRYPLKAQERRVARHFIGILDPFWFLILALELGLVVGLYVASAASFWLGLIAVLLLFVSNYLLARVVALLLERLMQRKFGAAVLLGAVACVGFLPAILQPVLKGHRGAVAAFLHVLSYTPPFAAAATMTRTDVAAFSGLLLQVWWLLGLAAALVALERRPPQTPRAAQTTAISWDTPYDRLAAFFGPRLGPLMAHWLRFYMRNNRFRTIYAMALPLAASMIFAMGREMGTRVHAGSPFACGSDRLRHPRLHGNRAVLGQPVRLRGRRIPPLLAAARAAGGCSARRQLHLHADEFGADCGGHSALCPFLAFSFRRAHVDHAGGSRGDESVRVSRAGALGHLVRPALLQLLQQLRKRPFGCRQHGAHRRNAGGDGRRRSVLAHRLASRTRAG